MPTALDAQRLRDGAVALSASLRYEKMSLAELYDLREQLRDGAAAMQSLDDLGSEEANDAAWSDMCTILDHIKLADSAILRAQESK